MEFLYFEHTNEKNMTVYLPMHLPNRVGVFARADGGRVDRTVDLVAHVEDHHSAIIAANREKGAEMWVEV